MSGVDIAMAVIAATVVVGVAINCWMIRRIERSLQRLNRSLQRLEEIDRDLQELNERLESLHEAILLAVAMRQRQIESGQNPQLPGVCEKGRKEVNNELQGIPEGQTERDSTVGTGEARG